MLLLYLTDHSLPIYCKQRCVTECPDLIEFTDYTPLQQAVVTERFRFQIVGVNFLELTPIEDPTTKTYEWTNKKDYHRSIIIPTWRIKFIIPITTKPEWVEKRSEPIHKPTHLIRELLCHKRMELMNPKRFVRYLQNPTKKALFELIKKPPT